MSRHVMAPAYTAVQAAPHAFTQPPVSHTHHAEPKRMEWPESVKDYVRRSFEPDRVIPHISRSDMERKLKEVITRAAESGQLLTTNWSTYPLPQELLQQEQLQGVQLFVSQPIYSHANQMLNIPGQSPPFPKKRKMEDQLDNSSDPKTPPWRQSNPQMSGGFENRITYANKGQADRMEKRLKKAQIPANISSKFQEDLEKRRRRFDQAIANYSPRQSSSASDDEDHFDQRTGPVIGTCTKLEKNYYRLTSPPKPREVRPKHILEQAFKLVKDKWKQNGDYNYACNQFKSLRQDLTVQHIKDEFSVKVYETHARIALEKGDLGEYNQCQTQLRALYSLGIKGSASEFLAYRILYFIHTGNRTGLNELLTEVTLEDKEQEYVKHALDVRSASASGNYHRLFKLWLMTPNMGAYLMDNFILRERFTALAKMCTAYNKSLIPLRFVTEELGFESDDDTFKFFQKYGADETIVYDQDPERNTESEDEKAQVVLQCSQARLIFQRLSQEAHSKVDIKGQI